MCVRVCLCVCVSEAVRLIQVLSRREDKNLLPACWASESANRREVDPNNLCPGPGAFNGSDFLHGDARQKTTCGREGAGIYLSLFFFFFSNLHIINPCKHEKS